MSLIDATQMDSFGRHGRGCTMLLFFLEYNFFTHNIKINNGLGFLNG
jgi:hypothetical protein